MILGTTVWILVALVCYLFLKRTIFSVFDPLLLGNIFIPFSAALLATLCATDWIGWDKFVLFCVVLLGYLCGARAAASFFSLEEFRQTLFDSVSAIRRKEVDAILIVTLLCTGFLAALSLQSGILGDARQDFARAFRPIVVLQSGLFLVSFVLLLSPKISTGRAAIWLFLLIALSVPFSGKAILGPVLTWVGLKLFMHRKALTLRTTLLLLSMGTAGAGVMALLAYGVSGLYGTVFLLTNRLLLSGDVYVYAYEQDGLSYLRGNYPVSFLAYLMHPVTSLVGVRAYEKPIGSTMASELLGRDLLTGPNPQLPVVLDFFFPDALLTSFAVAIIIGLLVMSVRPLAIALGRSRSPYIRVGAIAAAVFSPNMGFLDLSLVIIALIGILAVVALGTAMELLVPRQHRSNASDQAVPVAGK